MFRTSAVRIRTRTRPLPCPRDSALGQRLQETSSCRGCLKASSVLHSMLLVQRTGRHSSRVYRGKNTSENSNRSNHCAYSLQSAAGHRRQRKSLLRMSHLSRYPQSAKHRNCGPEDKSNRTVGRSSQWIMAAGKDVAAFRRSGTRKAIQITTRVMRATANGAARWPRRQAACVDGRGRVQVSEFGRRGAPCVSREPAHHRVSQSRQRNNSCL